MAREAGVPRSRLKHRGMASYAKAVALPLTLGLVLASTTAQAELMAWRNVLSTNALGKPGNGHSGMTGIGRARFERNGQADEWIVFDTQAGDLVPNDTNGASDIVARGSDGRLRLISRTPTGAPGNGPSTHPSADGRYITFQSDASDLTPNDTNGVTDVFLYDCVTDELRNVTGQRTTYSASMTPFVKDGWLVFASLANNLVPSDFNTYPDIFALNLTRSDWFFRATVTPTGLDANAPSRNPRVWAESYGGIPHVVYESFASNLATQIDRNGRWDVYWWSGQDGLNHCVSRSATAEANGHSVLTGADRGRIQFVSDATNLVPGDTNAQRDAFESDGGSLRRVSLAWDGRQLDGRTTSAGAGWFVTGARNAAAIDVRAGSELMAERAGGSVVRSVYGADQTEPNGNIQRALDGGAMGLVLATDASNVNGGSLFVQVVEAGLATVADPFMLVAADRVGGQSAAFGAVAQPAGSPGAVLERAGDLPKPWRAFGALAVTRGYLGYDLFVYNSTSGEVALWAWDGLRGRTRSTLGTLAAGWTPECLVAMGPSPASPSRGIVVRRADDTVGIVPVTAVGLGAVQLLARIAGRFPGEGHFVLDYEKEYSLAWFDPVTRGLGGLAVHSENGLRWQSVRGQVAAGWRVVTTRRTGWITGELVVQRTSDGRIGAYVMDRASITGWRSYPSAGTGWPLVLVVEGHG